MVQFVPFPKIGRLKREMLVTEKLDGTNAAVQIVKTENITDQTKPIEQIDGFALYAQSRNRFITPDNDNFGFARWVRENAAELVKLGEGVHFGEWWGQGIRRGYGLKEKRFSLFNVIRWEENPDLPQCCHVVPLLYRGEFDSNAIDMTMEALWENGSVAAPGFKNPEGIIVYHVAAKTLFKRTFENDNTGKEAA